MQLNELVSLWAKKQPTVVVGKHKAANNAFCNAMLEKLHESKSLELFSWCYWLLWHRLNDSYKKTWSKLENFDVPNGSVVLRRWRSRESGEWRYGLLENWKAEYRQADTESEFMLIQERLR